MTPQISSASPVTIGLQGDHMLPLASNMKALDMTLDRPQAALPHSVDGPLVWSGPSLANEKGYTFHLSASDVAEAEKALDSFKTLGLDGDLVSTANFPLPTLGPKLKECARSLYDGMGLVVIRGLDAGKHSAEDNLMMYLGISSYIGDKRGIQDRRGNVLAHVTDAKQWKKVPLAARHGIHQRGTLPFHTDMGAEILSLQVRQCAVEGGATCVASAWTVYNELMLCHPEELRVLATPNWPIQVSGKTHRYICSPLIQVSNGKVYACLDRSRLGPHPLSRGVGHVPSLTPAQVRALTTLMEVASRHQLRVQAQSGDLVYINNFFLLHAREKYEDGATTARHLVRMWLHNSRLGCDIPENMKAPWTAAFGPEAELRPKRYLVVPGPDYEVPRYTSGSAAFVVEDSDEDEETAAGPST